ncbi:hypothetical protein HPB51_019930 [Rhipicephalus microplus]|uniref:Uncharacterized protein n=1 Tax=Rhipicephalus microplus TaxID=6941 RepID=A0A9J6E474_RHIMP|nr:hypothetical protein HPB51_019930 [Rhipicephalus microplus]
MTDEEETPLQEKPGRSKKAYVIAAVVVLLVLGCGAAATYYSLGGSGGSDDVVVVHGGTEGCRCVHLGNEQGGNICVCPERTKPEAEVSQAIATGLVQNMASRRKRGLREDEILQLVFDSDAESDICDDEDVSLDDEEDQSDESSSDEEEEENQCAAGDPLDTLPPSSKARKMEEWQ